MPTVPVNILSKCVIYINQVFRIYNEGYDNINLKHKFSLDEKILNLKINYLDGKTLNGS